MINMKRIWQSRFGNIMDMVVIDMAIFLVSTFRSRTYSKNESRNFPNRYHHNHLQEVFIIHIRAETKFPNIIELILNNNLEAQLIDVECDSEDDFPLILSIHYQTCN